MVSFSSIGWPRPGSTSRNMSFRPVLVRSSAVASFLIRRLYLGSICRVTSARPSLSSTFADVADLHAGDPDGLPLARLHGLRVGQLDPDLEGLLLHEREAQPLLGEDVPAHGDGQDAQRDDREEVAQVFADRLLHLRASAFLRASPARSALSVSPFLAACSRRARRSRSFLFSFSARSLKRSSLRRSRARVLPAVRLAREGRRRPARRVEVRRLLDLTRDVGTVRRRGAAAGRAAGRGGWRCRSGG